jgi:hypothetical protein
VNPAEAAAKQLELLAQQKMVAESELRLLALKLEQAKLDEELKRLSRPPRRSWNALALGALLAVAAPATAGVYGYCDKMKQLALAEQRQQHELAAAKEKQQRDLALAKEKQAEELRSRYLDRMGSSDERMRTLRYLSAVTHDPDLRAWVALEQSLLDKEISRLAAEGSLAEAKAQKAEQARREALARESEQAQEARVQAEHKKAPQPDILVRPMF